MIQRRALSGAIRCNAIAPGLILTPGLRANVAELIGLLGPHLLVTRLGEPEDIAALAAYLASDESGYMQGEVICCDGGLGAHHPQIADVLAYARTQAESPD